MPISTEVIVEKLLAASARRSAQLRGFRGTRQYNLQYRGLFGTREATMQVRTITQALRAAAFRWLNTLPA